jgi:hypothetical protein
MELDAIATLWRRERRALVTSFSGTSMLPTIAPGQQVTVECGVEPSVGEIAVFRFDNQVGVHRVVARGATWLLTWGDANPLPDDPIEPQCVIGAIRNTPAPPRSLRRALFVQLAARPTARIERVTRRVRVAHRIRSEWMSGPIGFFGATVRFVARRILPGRSPHGHRH